MGLPVGGLAGWLATNSIPNTIANADGYLAINLKWFGVANPPAALATQAADHTVLLVSFGLILIGSVAALSWGGETIYARWYANPKELAGDLAIKTKPDLSYWSQVDDMPIWAAAYLWCDKNPPKELDELPPDVAAKLHRLLRAVDQGALEALNTDKPNAHPLVWAFRRWATSGRHAIVTRAALRAYADCVHERPTFLFR